MKISSSPCVKTVILIDMNNVNCLQSVLVVSCPTSSIIPVFNCTYPLSEQGIVGKTDQRTRRGNFLYETRYNNERVPARQGSEPVEVRHVGGHTSGTLRLIIARTASLR